jgi:hypothetical protein
VTRWKPGNNVTLRQMLAAVEKNGFANKGSKVVVAGTVSQTAGMWRLAVTGTSESYELVAANAKAFASLQPGTNVVVTGSLPEPPKGAVPAALTVEKLEQVEASK